jgi:hypothetical protein
LPSLWFNAWRCRCSDLENDFPQSGKLQQNFFLTSRSCDFELEVEEDETDAFLVLVGAIMGDDFQYAFLVLRFAIYSRRGRGFWEKSEKRGQRGRGELWAISMPRSRPSRPFTYMIIHQAPHIGTLLRQPMIGRVPTEAAGQQQDAHAHDVPAAGRLDRCLRWVQVRGRYDPKVPRASDGAHQR